jgi:hypothetical protein
MRFVVLRKSDKNMESGASPGKETLAAMRKYDEELIFLRSRNCIR